MHLEVRRAIQEAEAKGILKIDEGNRYQKESYFDMKCNKYLSRSGISRHLYFIHNIGKRQVKPYERRADPSSYRQKKLKDRELWRKEMGLT